MRHRGRSAIAAVLGSVLLLSGCTQAVSGTGESTEGITFPSDIQGLGALLTRGNNSIKTAHLQLTEGAAGETITAHGDEELSNGTVKSIDLSETVSSLDLRFIIIGTKVYAQLPAAVYQSPKPWVEISPTTADSTLQQLYTSFETSIQTGAGKSIGSLVSAGKDLSFKGKEQVGGVTVGHYELNVDVNSLPTDFPNRDALLQTGLTKFPVGIYVDQQGRPRKVTEHVTVKGEQVDVLVTLTNIDAPVHIVPPPADQVAHP
jgi:hypothetical protein